MKLCRPFGAPGLHSIAPYLHPHARPFAQRGLARRALDGTGSTGADDLLKQADELLAQMAQGNFKKTVPAEEAQRSMEDPGLGYQLQCDVNGCTIVPVARQDAARTPSSSFVGAGRQENSATPSDFVMAEGKGWKLGYDRSPASSSSYSALIGSEGFSFAITRQEYDDFIKLMKNLRQSVATLQICGEWGSANDDATLEMSTDRVWMQGRAPQKRLTALQNMWNRNNGTAQEAFALRFIFTAPDHREVEGSWSAETVMTVLSHLDSESELLPPGFSADLAEAVAA
ncbi:g2292 [Coccomyxa viridis]|uniref:G2292 protein n=1 Tax=Coccomyxa viridis TaxID=1274662 RepID=A0ABP1FM92_9CHLO